MLEEELVEIIACTSPPHVHNGSLIPPGSPHKHPESTRQGAAGSLPQTRRLSQNERARKHTVERSHVTPLCMEETIYPLGPTFKQTSGPTTAGRALRAIRYKTVWERECGS